MKKLAFSLLFLGIILQASHAQAQIPAGTKLLGGNFTFTSDKYSAEDPNFSSPQKTATNKVWGLYINPSAGVFLADNLAAGFAVGFGTSKSTQPYYDPTTFDKYVQVGKQKTVYASPFLRYYYLPTETFGLYGQLSAGYSRQWGETESGSSNLFATKNSGHSVFTSITPALVFFPVAKLGLELTFGSIGYDRSVNKSNNSPATRFNRKEIQSSFRTNFGFNNLALGASYYIGR
jgi:hypothetical protein